MRIFKLVIAFILIALGVAIAVISVFGIFTHIEGSSEACTTGVLIAGIGFIIKL